MNVCVKLFPLLCFYLYLFYTVTWSSRVVPIVTPIAVKMCPSRNISVNWENKIDRNLHTIGNSLVMARWYNPGNHFYKSLNHRFCLGKRHYHQNNCTDLQLLTLICVFFWLSFQKHICNQSVFCGIHEFMNNTDNPVRLGWCTAQIYASDLIQILKYI